MKFQVVIPAKAGIQYLLLFNRLTSMDPRIRGDDDTDYLSAFNFETGSTPV